MIVAEPLPAELEGSAGVEDWASIVVVANPDAMGVAELNAVEGWTAAKV